MNKKTHCTIREREMALRPMKHCSTISINENQTEMPTLIIILAKSKSLTSILWLRLWGPGHSHNHLENAEQHNTQRGEFAIGDKITYVFII